MKTGSNPLIFCRPRSDPRPVTARCAHCVNQSSRDGKNREPDFSSLGPEIDDADLLEVGVEMLAAEGLVIRMGKVGIPVRLFPE